LTIKTIADDRIKQNACHHRARTRRRFAYARVLGCKIREVAVPVVEMDSPASGAAFSRALRSGDITVQRGNSRRMIGADQVLTSQPMSIMVLMQSSGRYDIHCRMFSSERAVSASFNGTAADAAAPDESVGGSTKAGCGIRESVCILCSHSDCWL
jgi:hypothetical protein